MKTSHLRELMDQSESEKLDFKSQQYRFVGATDDQKGELLKDIIAMANACKGCDAHILIGIEEHGRANRVCGADPTLDDAAIQQFVNSKTNRRVSFMVETLDFEKQSITVIKIHGMQEWPIFLTSGFGRLKANVVYVRRGSSTGELTPDELRDATRKEILDSREHEKAEGRNRFWRDFRLFLPVLQKKIFHLENEILACISEAMYQYRLPFADAREILRRAREVDLPDAFLKEFGTMVDQIGEIDEYMNRGIAVFKQFRPNLRYTAQELRCLATEIEKRIPSE